MFLRGGLRGSLPDPTKLPAGPEPLQKLRGSAWCWALPPRCDGAQRMLPAPHPTTSPGLVPRKVLSLPVPPGELPCLSPSGSADKKRPISTQTHASAATQSCSGAGRGAVGPSAPAPEPLWGGDTPRVRHPGGTRSEVPPTPNPISVGPWVCSSRWLKESPPLPRIPLPGSPQIPAGPIWGRNEEALRSPG